MTVQVLEGDCRVLMAAMEPDTFDSIVTDPPSGIHFMGRDWDHDRGGRQQWIAWMTEIMRECYRVLKPGGHAVVWALPRTSHWTATAIEDAGFDVRDIVMHLFGSGFPKSLDVSKAIDKAAGAEREVVGIKSYPREGTTPVTRKATNIMGGERDDSVGQATNMQTAPATDAAREWAGWGTALKPAAEHWILARKPLSESGVAANVLRWGTGGINVDGCRIEGSKAARGERTTALGMLNDDGWQPQSVQADDSSGRWPANLVLDSDAAELLDEQSGERGSGPGVHTRGALNGGSTEWGFDGHGQVIGYGDTGGASRFFKIVERDSCDIAKSAGLSSSPSSQAADSAQRVAVTASGQTGPATPNPSTSVMLSESKQNETNDTPAIQSTERRYSPEPSPESMADPASLANDAATQGPTDTTMTTTSRCNSCGCAGHATFNDTSRLAEAGAVDFAGKSRLFYTAKASRAERSERVRQVGGINSHPTVKPVELMRWLCRLVTRPGGHVLDPFVGSGSTLVAALMEGFDATGIDLNPEYVAIARQRIDGIQLGGLVA